MFYFRGSKREPKKIVESHISTPEDKLRRHKNKERIWRRCVARLAFNRLALLEQSKAPA